MIYAEFNACTLHSVFKLHKKVALREAFDRIVVRRILRFIKTIAVVML